MSNDTTNDMRHGTIRYSFLRNSVLCAAAFSLLFSGVCLAEGEAETEGQFVTTLTEQDGIAGRIDVTEMTVREDDGDPFPEEERFKIHSMSDAMAKLLEKNRDLNVLSLEEMVLMKTLLEDPHSMQNGLLFLTKNDSWLLKYASQSERDIMMRNIESIESSYPSYEDFYNSVYSGANGEADYFAAQEKQGAQFGSFSQYCDHFFEGVRTDKTNVPSLYLASLGNADGMAIEAISHPNEFFQNATAEERSLVKDVLTREGDTPIKYMKEELKYTYLDELVAAHEAYKQSQKAEEPGVLETIGDKLRDFFDW